MLWGSGPRLDYLSEVGLENIARHEHDLLTYAAAMLNTVPGLHIIGTAAEKAGVISFVLDEFRAEDVGAALNQEGIALRRPPLRAAYPTSLRPGGDRPAVAGAL